MITEDIIFPIPISGDRIITIHNLPIELDREDAEKIAKVIIALSSDNPPLKERDDEYRGN